MKTDIYTLEHYTFAYPDTTDDTGEGFLDNALKDISLQIRSGEFVVLAGSSGCGKTTLLRQLKSSMAPYGKTGGTICFQGLPLSETDERKQASSIGFVMQDVDAQLVTDKVWHELAFGLESLGYRNDYIRRRVAEMCSFFGLDSMFHKKVSELSGGQKQLVNLASIMAMHPEVLILDEPTSQLDPIAAGEFIGCLARINRELGTAVILTEHRLEEVLPICSRVVIMEQGEIVKDGDVKTVLMDLQSHNLHDNVRLSMPAAVRIALTLDKQPGDSVPVTVGEGKNWLAEYEQAHPKKIPFYETETTELSEKNGISGIGEKSVNKEKRPVAAELRDIRFRYGREQGDVLSKLSLKIYKGEILVINGSNGSGKSTLLSILAGIYKPYMGQIKLADGIRTGLLPQDPKTLFTHKTVKEELMDAKDRKQLAEIIRICRLETLLKRHPYDLSGGEQQRLALARVLMGQPDLILMDEPTKGMDSAFKQEFRELMATLQKQGKTIVLVSHDIEFCAESGDRAALVFDGGIAAIASVRQFYSQNVFYTTQAARIAADIVPGAVTVSDVTDAFGADSPFSGMKNGAEGPGDQISETAVCDYAGIVLRNEKKKETLSVGRILTILLSAIVIVYVYIKSVSQKDLTQLVSELKLTELGKRYLLLYGCFICAVIAFVWAVRPKQYDEKIELEQPHQSPGRRTWMTVLVLLLAIPLTIWFGYKQLGDKKYYFISLMVLLEAMLPFFLVFEGRKPKVRELVTIAVMCAMAVAGRAAFSMLPNFSPVAGLVVITGVAFGGEAGFITGAATMLVSNIISGQGPWTPWQMFSMGLVGFASGLLFAKKGVRTRLLTKLGLCIFSALACVVIYGGIMNPASILIWQPNATMDMLIAAYVTGFPFDVVQATSTAIFLWIAARPLLEKLDRIRIKYGMMESRCIT